MDRKLFSALALILLLGAGCATTGGSDTAVNGNPSETSNIMADDSADTAEIIEAGAPVDLNGDMVGDNTVADTGAEANLKEFTVIGDNFEFAPANMTVKKGDTVRITFQNNEGFHDLVIDEFAVATKQISAMAEETIEFTADKTGSFEYYCSVGSHRAMGMKGTLTVTE